jgi:hypothetical protein
MKFYLMHHLHINPSEIEKWDFYEYQYTINNLVEHLKKEKDGRKDQEEQSADQYSSLSSSIQQTQASGVKGADKYMKGISPSASLKGTGLKSPSIKVPGM